MSSIYKQLIEIMQPAFSAVNQIRTSEAALLEALREQRPFSMRADNGDKLLVSFFQDQIYVSNLTQAGLVYEDTTISQKPNGLQR